LLQGNIHHIAAGGGSDGNIGHSGEEVGYVLDCEIELIVDGRRYRAKAGRLFSLPLGTAAWLPQYRQQGGARDLDQHAAHLLIPPPLACERAAPVLRKSPGNYLPTQTVPAHAGASSAQGPHRRGAFPSRMKVLEIRAGLWPLNRP
jgi:Cupin domain